MKVQAVSIHEPQSLQRIGKALSHSLRLEILSLLGETSFTINEIATQLSTPVSTITVHVQMLEAAGLVTAAYAPGKHGQKKLCSRKIDSLMIDLERKSSGANQEQCFVEIPIGSFTDCAVQKTCGMASERMLLVPEDRPEFFFSTDRFRTQILWFGSGFVAYKFCNPMTPHFRISGIEISLEVCSEAPNYRNDYPSDITLSFNGIELGTFTCAGDYGGRKGALNPPWWSSSMTQYGELKTWRITDHGTYLDHAWLSDCRLDAVDPYAPVCQLQVGVKDTAKNKRGMNLFGKAFGDYHQDIVVRFLYGSHGG